MTPYRPQDTVEGVTTTADALPVPKVTSGQQRAAALYVCSQATDVDDARQLLDALGLTGRPLRTSLGGRKSTGAKVVHGTGGGVEAHRVAGHQLCGPCQRWQDVEDRKTRPKADPVEREKCGTRAGWMAHAYHHELPCDRCATAHADYHREYARTHSRRRGAVSADG